MTIQQVLKHAAAQLHASSLTPRLDAEVLLLHVLQTDRLWLSLHSNNTISEPDLAAYHTALQRRLSGEPIAYIAGTKEFYGREFIVCKDVLVPRPESESFITLLRQLATSSTHGFVHHILDIGTGSGCIAITAKLELPQLVVTATDISKKALVIAAKNALKLKSAVTFFEQDLLFNDKRGYDVILANLPYVPSEQTHASTAYEPSRALYSGPDGLDHYRRLFEQLIPKHIRFVLTESLTTQHSAVAELAASAGYSIRATDGLVQLFTLNRPQSVSK